MKSSLFRNSFSALLATLLIVAAGCATNPVTGKKEFMLVSREGEQAMGDQADPQIIAQMGLYDDPQLQNFIQEKGQQMASISHRSNLDYKFRIVDSPVINAFAVPGGYVYFTRGIMAHFNNEAQFAGVLGHEIGHITARHSASQQSKAQLAQVGLLAGAIASSTVASNLQGISQGMQLLFLKYGRDDERQSDKLGVEYSTKIGYDAEEMAYFFSTLERNQQQSGQVIPEFLSSHPSPANRYQNVLEMAREWKAKTPEESYKVGRESYLKMIDGMIYGEDPKQGFVENNTFYHPELKFQFPVPQGWQYQNTPQAVQMASSDGGAAITFTLAQGNSAEAAAQQMVEQYQMQVVDSKRVSVNGMNAVAVVADVQQQQGTLRTLTYFIEYGDNIYSIMGITTAQNFDNYANTFTSVATNFDDLTDPDKLNRKPERISIKTIPRAMTLSQALQSYNTPQDRLEELAILNGFLLTEQLPQGYMIKTVSR
jgi:predicted Zn-dependent protease